MHCGLVLLFDWRKWWMLFVLAGTHLQQSESRLLMAFEAFLPFALKRRLRCTRMQFSGLQKKTSRFCFP